MDNCLVLMLSKKMGASFSAISDLWPLLLTWLKLNHVSKRGHCSKRGTHPFDVLTHNFVLLLTMFIYKFCENIYTFIDISTDAGDHEGSIRCIEKCVPSKHNFPSVKQIHSAGISLISKFRAKCQFYRPLGVHCTLWAFLVFTETISCRVIYLVAL